MKVAVVVGGWYFPSHLYKTAIQAKAPPGVELEYFTITHRDPSQADISAEMLPRIKDDNKYDKELYSDIISLDELANLGYKVHQAPNLVGDYFFFNQWAELYDYREFDYVLFMHDDNYLLEGFQDIFVDIFSGNLQAYKHNGDQWSPAPLVDFSYIANSPVGNRRTARGSFSIWSKSFLEELGGEFSIENVKLTRQGELSTPKAHLDLADWNMVGHNLQRFVEDNGYMESTYRLTEFYRVSRYMIECERGLVGNSTILLNSINAGYAKYIR